MAQYRITVKTSNRMNGVAIEEGMSTIIQFAGACNPLSSADGKAQIQEAFLDRVGVDLKKGGYLNGMYLAEKRM